MDEERIIEISNQLSIISKRTELGDLETRIASKLGAMDYWIMQLTIEVTIDTIRKGEQ